MRLENFFTAYKKDLIARQDDDDVSNLDRIQAQVDFMGKNRLDF